MMTEYLEGQIEDAIRKHRVEHAVPTVLIDVIASNISEAVWNGRIVCPPRVDNIEVVQYFLPTTKLLFRLAVNYQFVSVGVPHPAKGYTFILTDLEGRIGEFSEHHRKLTAGINMPDHCLGRRSLPVRRQPRYGGKEVGMTLDDIYARDRPRHRLVGLLLNAAHTAAMFIVLWVAGVVVLGA